MSLSKTKDFDRCYDFANVAVSIRKNYFILLNEHFSLESITIIISFVGNIFMDQLDGEELRKTLWGPSKSKVIKPPKLIIEDSLKQKQICGFFSWLDIVLPDILDVEYGGFPEEIFYSKLTAFRHTPLFKFLNIFVDLYNACVLNFAIKNKFRFNINVTHVCTIVAGSYKCTCGVYYCGWCSWQYLIELSDSENIHLDISKFEVLLIHQTTFLEKLLRLNTGSILDTGLDTGLDTILDDSYFIGNRKTCP